jgi:hypothetical protein
MKIKARKKAIFAQRAKSAQTNVNKEDAMDEEREARNEAALSGAE